MYDVSRIVDLLRLTPIERQRREFDKMMLAGDPPPHVSTREDVYPEDFIASLLRSPHTPPESRQVCLEGCRRLYAEFEPVLAAGKALDDQREVVFQRLCSVVDLGQPPELADTAIRVAHAVLDQHHATPMALGASARAALAYLSTGEAAGLWTRMIRRKEIAGYGYRAMLALHPSEPDRLANELAILWERRLGLKWTVNVVYLMGETTAAIPALDPNHFQMIVLELLRNRQPALADRAAEELQNPPALFPVKPDSTEAVTGSDNPLVTLWHGGGFSGSYYRLRVGGLSYRLLPSDANRGGHSDEQNARQEARAILTEQHPDLDADQVLEMRFNDTGTL